MPVVFLVNQKDKMNFTPFPTLSTERLILRQMNSYDKHEIFKLRSDARVLKFIDIKKAETIADAEAFIEKINTGIANNESILWGICLKGSSALIGTICFWNILKEDLVAEIGYALLPGFQGKGIMQEAIEKVIEYGFISMKLKSIVADLKSANIKSINLLERNDFIYTGKLKEEEDMVIYTLSKAIQIQ